MPARLHGSSGGRPGDRCTRVFVKQCPGGALTAAGVSRVPETLDLTPDVSVVVPVYRNGDTLQALHDRLQRVLRRERLAYEILFVNDGCPCGSLAVLSRLAAVDSGVRVIALPENVGQHRAVLAGLAQAHGRSAVIMDADLQDPPEAIPQMLAELKQDRCAVFAGRRGRYESRGRLATSRLFKSVLHVLSGLPRDAGMYVAMNREMIRRLLGRREQNPFVVAMIGATRLPVTSIPIERCRRPSGESSYSAAMRTRVAYTAIRIAVRAAMRRTDKNGGTYI